MMKQKKAFYYAFLQLADYVPENPDEEEGKFAKLLNAKAFTENLKKIQNLAKSKTKREFGDEDQEQII